MQGCFLESPHQYLLPFLVDSNTAFLSALHGFDGLQGSASPSAPLCLKRQYPHSFSNVIQTIYIRVKMHAYRIPISSSTLSQDLIIPL